MGPKLLSSRGLLLLLLLASSPRLTVAATRYNIDFEEPVHHLNSPPTLGTTSDKVRSIIFGTPTVVADPLGAGNQVLELRAGSTYSQIQLIPPASLGKSFRV